MVSEGLNTKTPELKQSGHPASGAADNSSRSNSSSQFCTTNTSASRKTHLEYWVNRQACILVKVIPRSGLDRSLRLVSSLESNTSTSLTKVKTLMSSFFIARVTPGVMRMAKSCTVFTRFRELATTRAPSA